MSFRYEQRQREDEREGGFERSPSHGQVSNVGHQVNGGKDSSSASRRSVTMRDEPSLMGMGSSSSNNNIRKYLLLLHDCLAIKFVPLVGPPSSSTFPLMSGNGGLSMSSPTGPRPSRTNTPNHHITNTCGSSKSNKSNNNRNHSNYNHNDEDHQEFPTNNKSKSSGFNVQPQTTLKHGILTHHQRPNSALSNHHPHPTSPFPSIQTESSSSEVDHSLHGLYLYKVI